MLPGSAALAHGNVHSVVRHALSTARALGGAPAIRAEPAVHVHVTLMAASTVTTTTSAPIFLLPNGTFIVELVLFIIVFAVVAAVILPPLQKAMDGRAQVVRAAQQASDQGQAEAERLVAERHEVLSRARAEARSVLESASADADALFQQGRARGQAEHDRILSEAEPRLEEERAGIERELLGRVSELVVAAAGRVVGAPVDAVKHRTVIDEAVRRAARDDAGQG
jgi:F-type H+-transporting ATPase subunit b